MKKGRDDEEYRDEKKYDESKEESAASYPFSLPPSLTYRL